LWPFSTLGWPDKTEELDYFYPGDVLVTGYDIIFFWVIRMIFSGYEQMGARPFHTVLFHGLVRDDKGRKMSKSLGNGIDPLEIIDKYGADALRLTLVTGNAPGNDMRFYMEKVEANRNFANKVWNASRFILMNLPEEGYEKPKAGDYHACDRWIRSRLDRVVEEVTENMEKFEMGIAVSKVYDFIWNEFCDWYIELVKPRLYAAGEDPVSAAAALDTLTDVLAESLKLLHPFMPFITEEIYLSIRPEEESIMISDWPVYDASGRDEAAEAELEGVMSLVRGLRNVRSQMNVPNSKKVSVTITTEDKALADAFTSGEYSHLLLASEIEVIEGAANAPEDAVSVVTPYSTAYMPLDELVDVEKEKARLQDELSRLEKELKRSHGMLGNEKFVKNAAPAKVEEEREKLKKYEEMAAQVKERIAQLS
ncbi:MAG: class I tRNA ligase family protein, partial [Eubacterium sp.]|nr:class I tRNA ligase family protein [Eubacterium sp.]